MKLISVRHAKFGALWAVLVTCAILLGTTDERQNFVLAQNSTSIMPAPELSGSNDDDEITLGNSDGTRELADLSASNDYDDGRNDSDAQDIPTSDVQNDNAGADSTGNDNKDTDNEQGDEMTTNEEDSVDILGSDVQSTINEEPPISR